MAIPLEHLQGKYEILERLQEGGMGAIYKVRHRLLAEVRVIKLIRPHLESDPALKARFLREARAAARLSHPNIAQVYDYSVDEDGVAYIVMEFIKGLTLNELMRQGGRNLVGPTPVGRTPGEVLPLALVVEIARQSLRAIGHVHSHDIVHRDISPDNLMLTRDVDGRPLVKLIDLGLVKTIEGTSKLTAAGVFVGKFRYAAPEQFEDSLEGDRRRSDLYSFGVVLYELLTGKYPIVGKNPSSLIAGHLFRPPLPFSDSDPEGRVPARIRQAVLRSLAKRPEDRFASAESFAAALADEDPDLTSPDVTSVVEATQKIVRPILPAPRVGSTQSRLDRNFAAEPTPMPDESTVVMPSPRPSPPAAVLPHRRQERPPAEAATPAPASGGSPPSADPAGATRPAGDAGELLRQARQLHREGRVEEALATAERARKIAPQHVMIEVLLFELEREIESRRRKQTREASRRSAEAEIRELVDRGEIDAAAGRLPEALEVAGPTLVLRNLRAQIDRDLEAGTAAGELRDQSRRQRADELVAGARDRARGEEFAAAAELLRQALNLVPGHAEALTLRASVESCLQVQAEEIQEAEEVERTLTSIRTLLAGGEVGAALRDVGRAVQRFGERDDLRTLQTEATRAQTGDPAATAQVAAAGEGDDRSLEATVLLDTPMGMPADAVEETPSAEVTAEIAEVTASIRQLQSRGEHGRALETLQSAVDAHGTLDVFKELRYELGQAMLDRDAEEEDTGGRILDVLPAAQDRDVRLPSGLGDLALGPEPAPSARAFDETSARSLPPSPPPARQGGGRGGWKLPLALLLVVLVGLLFGVLLGQLGKSGSAETAAVTAEDVTAQALDPGFVILDAQPWAEITRIVPITDQPAEGDKIDEEVAITPSRYTPVVLVLPPGRYRLSLRYPPGDLTEDLDLEVVSGAELEHRVTFAPLDGEQYFDEVGW